MLKLSTPDISGKSGAVRISGQRHALDVLTGIELAIGLVEFVLVRLPVTDDAKGNFGIWKVSVTMRGREYNLRGRCTSRSSDRYTTPDDRREVGMLSSVDGENRSLCCRNERGLVTADRFGGGLVL